MNEVPPGRPGGHHLEQSHQGRGLPVTLAAEAVAVGHQSLDGQARQLGQVAEVLERVREGAIAAELQPGPQPDLDARGLPERGMTSAARSQLRHHVVPLQAVGDDGIHVRIRGGLDRSHQVIDAVAIDRDAEPDLDLGLVALRDRDLAHVVAEPADLEPARLGGAGRRACPLARDARSPRDPASDPRWWSVAMRSRVSTNPNSRSPCADWLRFMKSMSISAQGRSRFACVWRWTSGLRSAEQPRDPHLRGREGVHPGHDTQAGRVGISVGEQLGDALGRRDHRLGDDPDRDVRRTVEALRDLTCVVGHLGQRVIPVQTLAAGHEPGSLVTERLHADPLVLICPAVGPDVRARAWSARRRRITDSCWAMLSCSSR